MSPIIIIQAKHNEFLPILKMQTVSSFLSPFVAIKALLSEISLALLDTINRYSKSTPVWSKVRAADSHARGPQLEAQRQLNKKWQHQGSNPGPLPFPHFSSKNYEIY